MTSKIRRMGRPRKDDDRADARERLLDAAHELMCEHGTIDVRVNEIADRADLNVALINYYFGGKDGLLLDLAMRHQAAYAAVLKKLVEAPVTAARKLTLHIRGMVLAFRRAPYLQRLQHKILRESTADAARECGAALIQPLADFYRRLAAQGAEDGSLKSVDPMHLYVCIVGSCDFLYSGGASLAHGFGVDHVDDRHCDSYVDHFTDLVMHGLLNEEGGPERSRQADR